MKGHVGTTAERLPGASGHFDNPSSFCLCRYHRMGRQENKNTVPVHDSHEIT